jgi:hypothetical protein
VIAASGRPEPAVEPPAAGAVPVEELAAAGAPGRSPRCRRWAGLDCPAPVRRGMRSWPAWTRPGAPAWRELRRPRYRRLPGWPARLPPPGERSVDRRVLPGPRPAAGSPRHQGLRRCRRPRRAAHRRHQRALAAGRRRACPAHRPPPGQAPAQWPCRTPPACGHRALRFPLDPPCRLEECARCGPRQPGLAAPRPR